MTKVIKVIAELTKGQYFFASNKDDFSICGGDFAMTTMSQKYGVEFRHCNKQDTAKTLIEILKEGALKC